MGTDLSVLRDGCLLTLNYFGIFRHPLTPEEIHRFNRVSASPVEVQQALDELEVEGKVFRSGRFYMAEEQKEWITERLNSNGRAARLLDKVGRYASLIAACPFVRGIAISGSLSKHVAGEKADIDYFIITAADRLWITRSLLHIFKKLTFLTGHQHFFCMNYFIDTRSLEISHQNLYTAIETVTLLPVYNHEMLENFFASNEWVREYLPNCEARATGKYLIRSRKYFPKTMAEKIIGFLFPERLNKALMELTDRKWRRKWERRGYPETDYDRAFLTDLHISKNHPVDYEKKVMSRIVEFQHIIV